MAVMTEFPQVQIQHFVKSHVHFQSVIHTWYNVLAKPELQCNYHIPVCVCIPSQASILLALPFLPATLSVPLISQHGCGDLSCVLATELQSTVLLLLLLLVLLLLLDFNSVSLINGTCFVSSPSIGGNALSLLFSWTELELLFPTD